MKYIFTILILIPLFVYSQTAEEIEQWYATRYITGQVKIPEGMKPKPWWNVTDTVGDFVTLDSNFRLEYGSGRKKYRVYIDVPKGIDLYNYSSALAKTKHTERIGGEKVGKNPLTSNYQPKFRPLIGISCTTKCDYSKRLEVKLFKDVGIELKRELNLSNPEYLIMVPGEVISDDKYFGVYYFRNFIVYFYNVDEEDLHKYILSITSIRNRKDIL